MISKIKDYFRNLDLKRQLGVIVIFSLILSLVSLFLILPNLLTPFYEKNIYEVLRQPLPFIDSEKKTGNDVAFIIDTNNNIYVSSNFTNYFNKSDVELIRHAVDKSFGNFILNNRTYYYRMNIEDNRTIITLTDDTYIRSQQRM